MSCLELTPLDRVSTENQLQLQLQLQLLRAKLTGLRESSSKGTAKEFVQSTTPFDTMPSKTPTTRLRVPRATLW